MTEAVVEQTQTQPAPSTGGAVSPEPTHQADTGESRSTEKQAASEVSTQQEQPKPKRDGGFQRRIDQLTRDKYQLEARLRALEETRQQQPAQQPKGEPKREQFESYEDYLAAKAEHAAEAAAERRLAKAQEESRRQTEVQRATQLAESWQAKQDKAREQFEDYDDVVANSSAPVTAAMRDSIMESDIGPSVLRHLAMHPEDAERISKLSPASQAREIGKIEAALLAPKPPAKAPETKPIEPVGQSGAAPDGPDDKQSIKDWMEARKRHLRARRGF